MLSYKTMVLQFKIIEITCKKFQIVYIRLLISFPLQQSREYVFLHFFATLSFGGEGIEPEKVLFCQIALDCSLLMMRIRIRLNFFLRLIFFDKVILVLQ